MTETQPNWRARGSLALLVVYWLTLVTATHIPKVQEPLGFRNSDKIIHFSAYALLAVLASWALAAYGRWNRRTALLLVVAIALLGVMDELTQPLFRRHADVTDWVCDLSGAIAGAWVFGIVLATIRNRSARQIRT